MDDVLANPVWHALNSGNSHLSRGNERVKYFESEVSPFIAMSEPTADNFNELHQILPNNRISFLATHTVLDIPDTWRIVACVHGVQMLHNERTIENTQQHAAADLSIEHAAEMVALAKLTGPGPFDMRTIEFGHYQGIFVANKLVAMAGQRMHAFNYAEVSAVCTHPEHTGKGYARQLLINQINRIISAHNIPYLHVRHDNYRAIDLYSSLGFTVSSDMYFYILKK